MNQHDRSVRAIIHVDMDAFYASVEQRDAPALRGRPVMVGGEGRRGVVAAASYEARQFGVRSAMPSARARTLCPSGIFVSPRFERYRAVSAEIFELFREWTERVEGLSLDEAYLDVSEPVARGRPMIDIGRAIKRDIAARTGLTASVGMAHNKLLAKIASDYDKPDGLVFIPPDRVQRFLDPLPVQRISGIGPRTAERLNDAGIYTAGQLRRTGIDVLENLVRSQGDDLLRRAAGIDDRPVRARRSRRSVSQETTLSADLHRLEALDPIIRHQAGRVAARLAEKGLYGRRVTLKLRSGGFSTVTRSTSLAGYTRSSTVIAETAWSMLQRWVDWRTEFSIRLIGVGVSGLSEHPDEAELLQTDGSGDDAGRV